MEEDKRVVESKKAIPQAIRDEWKRMIAEGKWDLDFAVAKVIGQYKLGRLPSAEDIKILMKGLTQEMAEKMKDAKSVDEVRKIGREYTEPMLELQFILTPSLKKMMTATMKKSQFLKLDGVQYDTIEEFGEAVYNKEMREKKEKKAKKGKKK